MSNAASPPAAGAKRGHLLAVGWGVIAALIVLAMYWPARHNGFIWDDTSYLVHAPVYRDPAQWFDALFQPPTGQAVFRPLALLSFALPLWLGLTEPQAHHIIQLFIHGLNVLLVTLVAWRMFGREYRTAAGGAACAGVCGLVYGLHPALTETVLWIACRFDLLMAFFLLLALLADRAWADAGWKRACAVSALFLLAALCKETAAGFLLALPVVHWLTDGPRTASSQAGVMARTWAPHYKVYLGLIAACGIYLWWRYAVLGASLGMSNVMTRFDEIGSVGQRALVVAASLAEYIGDALWPSTNVAPNRVLELPVADAVRIIPALAGACGVAGLALAAALYTNAGRAPGLLVIAFLAALVPVSNLLPAPTYPGELQIAARYATFPLVFVCLAGYALVPALVRMLATRHTLVRGLPALGVCAWLVISVAIVRETIPLWHDEGVFFRWAIERAAPSSLPYLYINLGSHYIKDQDLPAARDAYRRAIEAQPRSRGVASLALYNLGNVEALLGNAEEALRVMRGALAVDPDNVYGRSALARLELESGHAGRAAELAIDGLRRLQAAGRSHPQEDLLHYQLGLAYRDLGRVDDAVTHLTAALAGARDPATRVAVAQALEAARSARK